MTREYRDKIFIRKDIIIKLSELGELNQTQLLTYCGLHLTKHKGVLDGLEENGFIEKSLDKWGNKSIIKYKVTQKGIEFCKRILEPYEDFFPRKDHEQS